MKMKRIIEGELTGKFAREIGEDHNLGDSPVIVANVNKPIFHESCYASGHAEEIMHIPGLAKLLSGHPSALHGWTLIKWLDCQSFVFAARSYQHDQDFYRLDN